jgi:hypothetical protein
MWYGGLKGRCVDPTVIWVAAGNVLRVRTGQQFGPQCSFVNYDGNPKLVHYPGELTSGLVIRDIAVDRDDWSVVYIVDSLGLTTQDAGATWTDITDNLGGFTTDLRTITLDRGTSAPFDEVVMVGGQQGVYRRLGTDRNNGHVPGLNMAVICPTPSSKTCATTIRTTCC